ncbi:hypothetical protein [Leucobacter komagatae]|uniref:arsenate reductase/protein-tyrosine-phosphatase family protein n=1 Tax=Leucobacter komagatae TaxID=55969 RepID=UPI002482A45C|nr:hypothetical protein [Leucobacter komagatae]
MCTANLCRSPYMEARLREQLRSVTSAPLAVGSAGTRARAGEGMASETLGLLTERGVPVAGEFQARQLTTAIVADSDLLLTASREQRAQVLEISPLALRRAFTLREFAALLCGVRLAPESIASGEWLALATAYALSRRTANAQLVNSPSADIDDPYGRGEEAFERMASEVDASIALILENLVSAAK